jgi:negative regulator of replication initiation
MSNKFKKMTIHIDNETYQLLVTLADKRGESISKIVRRILYENLESQVALEAQDALLSITRKAVARELRIVEDRLASLSAKAAITSASTENLVSYVLKLLYEPNIPGVRDACRKRGVAYVREPLNQIMQAYSSEE